MKPFRWNFTKKEQLGNLLEIAPDVAYRGYEQELSDCAVKVVARSIGRKLIFVGRSEEILLPPRDKGNIKASKQAFEIYCLGVGQKIEFSESWRLRSLRSLG